MDITAVYTQINDKLDWLAFSDLWPGFSRCGFALYNDAEVVLHGEILPKTDEFIANTAIIYKGEHIAIWQLAEEMDTDVLASKIAHEMFHAYQMERGESRFPDEMDALEMYEYSPAYLSVKYRENKLLAELCERFSDTGFQEFLSLRKLRMAVYPYQYRYECGIEVIEGSAQYVELRALQILSDPLYRQARADCIARIRKISSLMPARVLCYDTGAMLLDVCRAHGLPVNETIGETAEMLLLDAVFADIKPATPPALDAEAEAFYTENIKKFRDKIDRILKTGEQIVQGDFALLGVNVYSARYLDGYVYTEYFLMYEDEKPVTLYGNYLLRMNGKRIAVIYRET